MSIPWVNLDVVHICTPSGRCVLLVFLDDRGVIVRERKRERQTDRQTESEKKKRLEEKSGRCEGSREEVYGQK